MPGPYPGRERDLGEFLTPAEVRHYSRFLPPGSLGTAFIHPASEDGTTWTATVIWDTDPDLAAKQAFLAGKIPLPAPPGQLVRQGRGPGQCSSSQVLAMRPGWCWDVCGYYRRLGVHWRATRRELRQAYMRLGAHVGAGDHRVHYALSQLLDEDVRRAYDSWNPAQPFLLDRDVAEGIKRAAHRASAMMQERGYATTAEDVLQDWGLRLDQGDSAPGAPEDAPAPLAAPPRAPAVPWHHLWSWYAEHGAPTARVLDLEQWQQLLVRAFAARGASVSFGVGLCASPGFLIKPVYTAGILVILLGPGEPTLQLAEEAVTEWGFADSTRD